MELATLGSLNFLKRKAMSKKIKLKNRETRLLAKRARKASNKAKYTELRKLGMNSKSKRFLSNSKRKLAKTVNHPNGDCGNIACLKCFPDI